jgi:hypothetical protein
MLRIEYRNADADQHSTTSNYVALLLIVNSFTADIFWNGIPQYQQQFQLVSPPLLQKRKCGNLKI